MHNAAECRPWKPSALTHHHFKEAHEDRRERESEHPYFSGNQKMAELIQMAVSIGHEKRVIGNSAQPERPPRNTEDDPPCCCRHGVAPNEDPDDILLLVACKVGRVNAKDFATADPDNDGTLDKNEFLALAEKRFKAADPEDHGTIDAKELNGRRPFPSAAPEITGARVSFSRGRCRRGFFLPVRVLSRLFRRPAEARTGRHPKSKEDRY
jgi:hypothetical protein